MSNEDLVAEIQAGAVERLGDLWEQVEGLVKWKAKQIMTALEGCCSRGVELEDLYQSGYLAMAAAVKTYNSDLGMKFSSWMMYYLKTVFAQECGYRTEKQRNDPLFSALSLDAPLRDDDGNTLGDLQADPASSAPFEAVENRIYCKQLRRELESAIDRIPLQQAYVIRKRYFSMETLEEIALKSDKSLERIRQLEFEGLDNLRATPHRYRLEKFLDEKTPYYLHVGPSTFQRTHESAVERIVFLRERLNDIAKGREL